MGVPNYRKSLPDDLADMRRELAAVQIALRTQSRGPRGAVQGVHRYTTDHDLDASDIGYLLQMDSSIAISLTLPASEAVVPIGRCGSFVQWGSGVLTIVAAGGMTIRSTDGVEAPSQYTRGEWIRIDADEYHVAWVT